MTLRGFQDLWRPAVIHTHVGADGDQDGIVEGGCVVYGYVHSSTTDSAVSIQDATAVGGGELSVLNITNDGASDTSKWFGPTGIRLSTGLSISSSVNVRRFSVFYRPDA
jgi:hypothetical protein